MKLGRMESYKEKVFEQGRGARYLKPVVVDNVDDNLIGCGSISCNIISNQNT